MRYEVVVYYDDMVDSVHTFNNKNEAINELHLKAMTDKTKKACVIVDILEDKKYFFNTRREASIFFGKSYSWATTLIKTGIGNKGRYYGYDV